VDTSRIGITTAELMDVLEGQYQGDETARVTEVIVCCIVDTKQSRDGEVVDGGFSNTHFRGSDPVISHQLGLLEMAHHTVLRGTERE
jgi:hypothetical protein